MDLLSFMLPRSFIVISSRAIVSPTIGLNAKLVLYSRAATAWKIADFGLAVHGTSTRQQTTRYANGTACYRAPELVTLHNQGKFSNKVDIFAVGCILFEAVFLEKAFDSDVAVYEYAE